MDLGWVSTDDRAMNNDPHDTPSAFFHDATPTALAAVPPRVLALLMLIPGVTLVLHLFVNARGGYGFFRDELYYMASTSRLDWGYVDHPPLSIWLLATVRAVLGDSLFAVRLIPALASAATVVVVMLLARELGGGRWAMAFAGTATLISPIYRGFGSVYSMNTIDVLVWAVAAWLLARLIRTERPRLWLGLGLVLGIGLLNKASVLWFGAGLAVAIVATPLRRWLGTRWPWLGGMIAMVLFAPYVLWNFANDGAHLEFMRNAVASKYAGISAWDFLQGQVLTNHPLNFPVWLAGLAFLLLGGGGRFRALGIVFLAVVAILLLNGHSKSEYLAAAMTMVFAAGGVALASWTVRLRWLRPVVLAALLGGVVIAPLAMPILPVNDYIRFAERLGMRPHTAEDKELAELPQFYADMFGWREKAEAMAAAYRNLGSEEQERVQVYGGNYGRAGAIDVFGPALGLPPAISGHNSYWLWGPGDRDSDLVLSLGGELDQLRTVFESVEEVGRVRCRYCMPYESDLGIYLCRRAQFSAEEMWDGAKNYS